MELHFFLKLLFFLESNKTLKVAKLSKIETQTPNFALNDQWGYFSPHSSWPIVAPHSFGKLQKFKK